MGLVRFGNEFSLMVRVVKEVSSKHPESLDTLIEELFLYDMLGWENLGERLPKPSSKSFWRYSWLVLAAADPTKLDLSEIVTMLLNLQSFYVI